MHKGKFLIVRGIHQEQNFLFNSFPFFCQGEEYRAAGGISDTAAADDVQRPCRPGQHLSPGYPLSGSLKLRLAVGDDLSGFHSFNCITL